MRNELSFLRWHTVRLMLQNMRNTFAREHPLSIFDAVLKFAAGTSPALRGVDFFFHPLSKLDPIIRRDALYELEVVFPLASKKQCELFVEGLRLWLSDPAHNFTLREAGEVRERSLELLLEEHADLADTEELCLDFLTPLSIKPLSQRELYAFDGSALFRLISNRLHRWYGNEAEAALEAFRSSVESARLLPWFWEYAEFRHSPKSQQGNQFVNGMLGPLYLRGDIRRVLPLLLVMQELHIGPKKSAGRGAFRLLKDRPCMDERLEELSWYEHAFTQCSQDTDLPFFHEENGKSETLRRICENCSSSTWKSGTAEIFLLKNEDRDPRPVGVLPPDDLLAQRAVLNMLSPAVHRILPENALGWRAGKKRSDARILLKQAAIEGKNWLVRADIAHFFESIPHNLLEDKIDLFLPKADRNMRHFLREAVAMPARCHGESIHRRQGLIQGSPLSPLLANMYLQPADRAMEVQGFPFIRFGDDLLIPVSSKEAAEKALSFLGGLLEALELELAREKTAIFQDSCEFLGMEVQAGDTEEDTYVSGERRPLYVQQMGAFVGVDGDSVLVRRKEELLGKAPLHSVSEIFLYGAGCVSSRLIQKCAAEKIPLSFCTPAGWHFGTLAPMSREWYGRIGAHISRHNALSPSERAEAARTLVRAKMHGAKTWLLPKSEKKAVLCKTLELAESSLGRAFSPSEIMGVEGAFARSVFPVVNALVRNEAFRSERRLPRAKADLWNTLLDAAYSLLSARLYVLIQSAGLNPYLGFLHSPRDRYPSLVADMQEPFRHRLDQLALKLVNQGVVRPEHFSWTGQHWYLEKEGYAALVRGFERLLDTRFSGETLTIRRGLSRQVDAIRFWASREMPLVLLEQPCR